MCLKDGAPFHSGAKPSYVGITDTVGGSVKCGVTILRRPPFGTQEETIVLSQAASLCTPLPTSPVEQRGVFGEERPEVSWTQRTVLPPRGAFV